MDLYNRIDKIINHKGMSRRQLAIACEIPPSTLQTALSRHSGLTLENLQKIADVLNVPLGKLLQDNKPKIQQNTTITSLLFGDMDKEVLETINKWIVSEDEKANLFSIGEALKPTDSEMFRFNCNAIESCMEKMNRLGQSTAVKLVKELSETPEFQILPKKKPGQK